MNAGFDKPAIAAACPQDKRPTSKSLTANSIRASVSLIVSGRSMVAVVMGLVLLVKAYLRSWSDARGIGWEGEQWAGWTRASRTATRVAPSLNTAWRVWAPGRASRARPVANASPAAGP